MWSTIGIQGHTPHNDNIVLRKDGDGTSMVTIAKHLAKAMLKYVAPNLRGPKQVWVPSKSG